MIWKGWSKGSNAKIVCLTCSVLPRTFTYGTTFNQESIITISLPVSERERINVCVFEQSMSSHWLTACLSLFVKGGPLTSRLTNYANCFLGEQFSQKIEVTLKPFWVTFCTPFCWEIGWYSLIKIIGAWVWLSFTWGRCSIPPLVCLVDDYFVCLVNDYWPYIQCDQPISRLSTQQ